MASENRQNVNRTEDDLSSMFRESRQGEAPGYTNVEGGAEGLTGDKDAPFVKEPPFPVDALELAAGLVLPVAGGLGAEYVALPEIQCRQFRLLQIYFAYTMAVGGRVSFIPEVNIDGAWFVDTLVGGTVTPLVPAGTRFATGGFGSRALQGVELRTDALVGPGVARFALTFDVTAVERFRLNAIDITANAGNTLQAFYALSV